jgi:hypothetical protein
MDEDKRSDFISRIGTFFLLLGIGLMWLFVISDMNNATNFLFFLIGAMILVGAWYFKRISAPPRKDAGRFSLIRKILQKQREAKERKEASKKGKG